jgi:hypothetical protein
VRVVIDLERRPLSEEERSQMLEAQARTPNAIPRDYDSIWISKLSFEEPTDEPLDYQTGGHMAKGVGDEKLGWILEKTVVAASVQLTLRLSDQEIPLHPHFAELVGTPRMAPRAELAASLAHLLDLPDPHSEATRTLLVDLALLAHRCYYEFENYYDSTEIGHGLGEGAQSRLSANECRTALEELNLADDGALWTVAANLVRKMGFEVW